MVKRMALAIGLAAAGSVLVGGPAAADPDTEPVMCNFALGDPEVVDVSGTPMVRAIVKPGRCTGTAEPSHSVVCLTTPGAAGRCAELPGYTDVRVYLSPYQPGVPYTATGRGCAAVPTPPTSVCTTLGPTTVTL